MSRSFVSASSQYLRHNAFKITFPASQRTINIWGRTTVGAGTLVHHAKTVGFGGTGGMKMFLNSGNIRYESEDGTGISQCTTSAGVSSNVWFMATMSRSSDTDHRVYLNGGNKGSSSTSVALRNYNQLYISSDDGGGNYFGGQLAEITVWGNALTDHEVAMLYESRCQGMLVRPDSLLMHMSMVDDSDFAEFGTFAAGFTGNRIDFESFNSPTISPEHPSIVRGRGGLY